MVSEKALDQLLAVWAGELRRQAALTSLPAGTGFVRCLTENALRHKAEYLPTERGAQCELAAIEEGDA